MVLNLYIKIQKITIILPNFFKALYKMSKKEIIEELIFRSLPDTTENRRDFNKLMNNELARIPNKFSDYAENFLVGKFLGAIYSFQYTSLKNSLGVHTTLWKYNKIRKCLHLVF